MYPVGIRRRACDGLIAILLHAFGDRDGNLGELLGAQSHRLQMQGARDRLAGP